MRKLTSREIDNIHARLKSLQIQYTEVYEELFDHYHSALEETSETKSHEIFQKLNKDFSQQVVGKMEKALRQASKKRTTQLQIESFKFWKYDISISLSLLAILAISVFLAFYFGKYILSAWVGMCVVTGLVYMFSKDKALFRFNFIWNKGTVRAINEIVSIRLGILIGAGVSSLLNIQSMKFERITDHAEFFDIGNIFLLLLLLYGLSLFRIILSQELNTTTNLQSR